jgi:glycosyltransferase involved in cell wall biosynthesis
MQKKIWSRKKIYYLLALNKNFHGGGGLLRIIGLMKFLSSNSIKNKLYTADKRFSDKYSGVHVDVSLSKIQKRISQILIAVGLNLIASLYLRKELCIVKKELIRLQVNELIACEHFDLTIAFLLKKNKVIKNFICDIHGYSLKEFNGKGWANAIKRFIALKHDQIVFKSAISIIYPTKKLHKEMELTYSYTSHSFFYLPYLLTLEELHKQEIVLNEESEKIYQEFKNKIYGKKVIFFAGSFKNLSGVDDLVNVYIQSNAFNTNPQPCILFLIGDGLLRRNIVKNLENSGLDYIHVKSIEYKYLRCFQKMANIIVCPEPFNQYSNLIVHLKLLDSIASGRCVISARFDAIHEMKLDKKIITYKPSNLSDMRIAILNALASEQDFRSNSEFAKYNLTYEKFSEA